MTEIYLIRHAEAEGNCYRRIHGHYESLITPNGEKQIEALKRRFANVPIDVCYASDLYRTCRTAQAVFVPKKLPLHADARFRERALGRWEDTPFGQLEHFEAEKMHQFSHDERRWLVEGAEPYDALVSRMMEGLTQAAEENEGGTVAVFSHGCAIRAVQQTVQGSDDVPYCDNTAVSLFTYENGVWGIEYLNDNSHLPEEISTFAKQKWWRRDPDRKDYNLWYRQLSEGSWEPVLGDTPVGKVAVEPETGRLTALELGERFRNMALGPQLLGQAVSTLRRRGVPTVSVRLPAQSRARSFFAAQGFLPVQEQNGFVILEKNIVVP